MRRLGFSYSCSCDKSLTDSLAGFPDNPLKQTRRGNFGLRSYFQEPTKLQPTNGWRTILWLRYRVRSVLRFLLFFIQEFPSLPLRPQSNSVPDRRSRPICRRYGNSTTTSKF